ncbi:MAG: acyltransferase [Blastochloris sp.]|nr:acyltransferase [Blastochloris sp.]
MSASTIKQICSLSGSATAVLRARWYLRHTNHVGKRVRAWGRLHVMALGNLWIGDRVQLVGTITPIELAAGPDSSLQIGEQVFINYGCSIAALERVDIGPRCNIGTYVNIMDNNFHHLEPERRNERPASAAVTLEENVWLGARVIVLPGVRIGAGSVVAAGSIVNRDIPPRSLAAGVPARVIRSL